MKVTVEQDSMLSVHFVKTTLVRDEISRSMTIIRNLLPRHVIQQLVHDPTMDRFKGNAPPCDEFESVSILFADIVGFTAMSAQTTPQQLVDMLNSIFSVFDALAVKHSVYKVETIGDCYFCASGLPIEDKFHADNIIRMALDMQVRSEHLADIPTTCIHPSSSTVVRIHFF
jgi:class 3 adenylate cyclase